MFNKQYFDDVFVRQFEQLGSAGCSVVLHGGVEFKVRKIHEALDGYVLLEVFPEEGVNKQTRKKHRKPGGTDEVFWDRVAVAYESISHVRLTVVEPEPERMIGFST
jgi:hypothetical protein